MSTKVLVTGGTGFLGSYIIKQLVVKGYEVRAIRRSNKLPSWIPKEIIEKAEWIEGDILDVVALQDAMEGIDAIIHSAGIVSFAEKTCGRLVIIPILTRQPPKRCMDFPAPVCSDIRI